VIIDHDHKRVLDVLENREKATVTAYLKAGKASGVLASVEEVTTDMWDGYVEAAREVFGDGVAITIDRFHVMKNFQEGLTAARRELQRGLSSETKAKLKGSRWWWVTNPENLRVEDRESFAKLRLEFPQLAALWERREELRAIFEDRTIRTPEQGRERLEGWMAGVRKLALAALDKFCKTQILQDVDELDGEDQQLLPRAEQQWSNGRSESRNPDDPLACVWDDELQELPPPSPAPLRMP
jgi:transposase